MIKKELICHVQTLEEGEFIKINAIEGEPGYFLLSLGQNRMVINGPELAEAMQSISYYSTLFDQEAKAKAQRAAAPPKTIVVTPVSNKRGKKTNPEDEGALVLPAEMRTGPTASELALERQTKHMQGETIIITEKK